MGWKLTKRSPMLFLMKVVLRVIRSRIVLFFVYWWVTWKIIMIITLRFYTTDILGTLEETTMQVRVMVRLNAEMMSRLYTKVEVPSITHNSLVCWHKTSLGNQANARHVFDANGGHRYYAWVFFLLHLMLVTYRIRWCRCKNFVFSFTGNCKMDLPAKEITITCICKPKQEQGS